MASPSDTPLRVSLIQLKCVWTSITGNAGFSMRVTGTCSMLRGWKSLRRRFSPCDATVSVSTLAGVLGTTVDKIPAAGGYLSADPQLVALWREKLGDTNVCRVGVAWQGNPEYGGDRFRSIPLARFENLALPGVELVSLQKGFGAEQLAAFEAAGDWTQV